MSKKQKLTREEQLTRYKAMRPRRSPDISWEIDEKELVVLSKENTGAFNRMAQKLFRKPKVSYIHLDEFGSFVWSLADGEKTLEEIAQEVHARFGEKADPLYERLIKYFQILESYHFIG